MCGFAGIITTNKDLIKNSLSTINVIADKIIHRGPDFKGNYTNLKENVFLVHLRLSIIDLTSNANQPFISSDGRYVLCFNGEIYNHNFLRKNFLEQFNINWKSHSDTETLLYLIIHYGIEKSLGLLDGMFAFCFYDTKSNFIYFARDPFGEKPLYFSFNDNYLIFCSELKGLENLNFIDYELDISSVEYFKCFGYVPPGKTIYKHIKKVNPGEAIIFIKNNQKITLKNSINYFKKDSFDSLYKNLSENEVLKNFDTLFEKTVKSRMLADVSVGSFLSGGIDSSLVSYYAQKNSFQKINTFTIGFDNKDFDESLSARKVSEFIGSNHHTHIVKASDFLNVIEKLPNIYDEPFADPSQLPTLTLSKFASRYNKVCLSGDGADEFFSGYDRYRSIPNLWKFLKLIPYPLRLKFASFLNSKDQNLLDMFTFGNGYLLHRFSDALKAKNFLNLFDIARAYPRSAISPRVSSKIHKNQNIAMRLEDLNSFLHADVLNKVDIASMKYSLEVRSPFLSKDIFNFSMSLKNEHLNRSGFGKILLRKLLSMKLPSNLYQRPKKGFSVPIAEWLKVDLYGIVNDYIYTASDQSKNFYNIDYIKNIWRKHNLNQGDIGWNYGTFLFLKTGLNRNTIDEKRKYWALNKFF